MSDSTGAFPLVDYSRAVELYRGLQAAAIPRNRVAGADHEELVRLSAGWYESLLPVGDAIRDLRCAVLVDLNRWQVPQLLEHAPGSVDAGRIAAFLLPRCEVYEPGDGQASADGRLLSISEPTVLMAFLICDEPTVDAQAKLLGLSGVIEPDVQRRMVIDRQYHVLTWSLSTRQGPFRYREPVLGSCEPAGPAVAFPRSQTRRSD